MAKFFVGQMVRHIRSESGRVPVGAEGRIIEIGDILSDIGTTDCRVLFYGFKSSRGTDEFCSAFDQLEPILPEGAQPSEFSFTELMDNLGVVVA